MMEYEIPMDELAAIEREGEKAFVRTTLGQRIEFKEYGQITDEYVTVIITDREFRRLTPK